VSEEWRGGWCPGPSRPKPGRRPTLVTEEVPQSAIRSRPISATVRQPHSAIARSNSSRNNSSTWLTPASPSTASPHQIARPAAPRGRAPAGRAVADAGPAAGAAVEDHVAPPAPRLDPFRQGADRRPGGVELPPAVVRDDDADRAALHRVARVVAPRHPLD